MAVLYRLKALGQKGKTFLLLTDTHLIFESDPLFRQELTEGIKRGRIAGAPITGRSVAEATDLAMHFVEQLLAPKRLDEVELVEEPGRLTLRVKSLNFAIRNLQVEPANAAAFTSLFRKSA